MTVKKETGLRLRPAGDDERDGVTVTISPATLESLGWAAMEMVEAEVRGTELVVRRSEDQRAKYSVLVEQGPGDVGGDGPRRFSKLLNSKSPISLTYSNPLAKC